MRAWRFRSPAIGEAEVALCPAWTGAEIRAAVGALLRHFEHRLPVDRAARVVIKPNLNNDLVALTGNSVDLRVLDALLTELRARGYTDLTVADGSNVGVERRGINTLERLRVRPLCDRHGVRTVDLNHDAGRMVVLHGGAHPQVAVTVLDADFLISLPKVKTHVEAGLSCAMKNWVGITRGQDKRHMHRDLGRNIFALNEVVTPDLVLVDGLVGMEGNGPGDGSPYRLGQLLMSDHAIVNDVVVCQLIGLSPRAMPYLGHAEEAGRLDQALLDAVTAEVPRLRAVRPAPARGALARMADHRALEWLKIAARPITERPEVTALAYRLGVIQDVYSRQDDSLTALHRDDRRCGDCVKCVDFCPTSLPLAEIGHTVDPSRCITCLYCWWVCPKDALRLEGELGPLARQAERYKVEIEQL
jgi:uncharacterized protein (DUF362 family)/ferredoxin